MLRSQPSCSRVLCAASFVLALLLGLCSAASATSTNGPVYGTTTGPYYPYWFADSCVTSQITDGATNNGYIASWISGSGCSGSSAGMASGWIAVQASGFRSSGGGPVYCGTTGYSYNTITISYWGVSSQLCSNPSGSQEFWTNSSGVVYSLINGTWGYASTGTVGSGSDNY